MPVDLFARRMELISRLGCTVLPLHDALSRLRTHTLAPMSIVITFDDGFYNFYCAAYPVLKRYRYPVTVYQTSYYSACERPLFHLLCSYILWKGFGKIIDSKVFTDHTGPLDLRTAGGVNTAAARVWAFARSAKLSQEERQTLAEKLADFVGLDYSSIVKARLFNLMNRAELSELVHEGVDVQLHTHRHRMPNDKAMFLADLAENREFLKTIGQLGARYFAYPSGLYRSEVFPWLSDAGVRSATTCETGMVGPDSNCMCLPRLIDGSGLSEPEFESWLCGFRSFLWSGSPR